MPLDPSIYSQVGKVNLGAGIADELNQFTQQRAAQEDRQNRLAQLAMQMQEHKASQAALAALPPEDQQKYRLGMPMKDIAASNLAAQGQQAFQQAVRPTPLSGYELTPKEASTMTAVSPEEEARVRASGTPIEQLRERTPEEHRLAAYTYGETGSPLAKSAMSIQEFKDKQQQARELKTQQIEANKPEIVKLQEASQKLRDIGNNTMADQIDSRIELLGQPRNITPEPITKETMVDPKDPSRNIIVDLRKYDENNYLTKGDKTGILGQAPSTKSEQEKTESTPKYKAGLVELKRDETNVANSIQLENAYNRWKELNANVETGPIVGTRPISFSDDFQELKKIENYLIMNNFKPGQGAMSNVERTYIKGGAPKTTNNEQVNANIANIMLGVLENQKDLYNYKEWRLGEKGSLLGANKEFQDYLDKNPRYISDPTTHKITENTTRVGWSDYFMNKNNNQQPTQKSEPVQAQNAPASGATPVAQTAPASGADAQMQARIAIQKGADKAQVNARLTKLGYGVIP